LARPVTGKKTKKKIRISARLCVGCSYCKLNCPVDAIEVEDALARLIGDCTGCENCIWVCPVGAISLKGLPSRS
jgi:electron transport complex protein RnfB